MTDNRKIVQRYLRKVNKTLCPHLIDTVKEAIAEGWQRPRLADNPIAIAAYLIGQSVGDDPDMDPFTRQAFASIATNILYFHFHGNNWHPDPVHVDDDTLTDLAWERVEKKE